eukprot:3620881-Amphidinium_carterae.1
MTWSFAEALGALLDSMTSPVLALAQSADSKVCTKLQESYYAPKNANSTKPKRTKLCSAVHLRLGICQTIERPCTRLSLMRSPTGRINASLILH